MIHTSLSDPTCIFSTIKFVSEHAQQHNVTLITFDQSLWWKAFDDHYVWTSGNWPTPHCLVLLTQSCSPKPWKCPFLVCQMNQLQLNMNRILLKQKLHNLQQKIERIPIFKKRVPYMTNCWCCMQNKSHTPKAKGTHGFPLVAIHGYGWYPAHVQKGRMNR